GAPHPRGRAGLRVRELRARPHLRDTTGSAEPAGSLSGAYGLEHVSAGAVAGPFAVRPNERVVFGGIDPVQLALLPNAFVLRLSVVSVPFQTLLMVVPLGIVQPERQPLSVVVPGLWIVTSAW